MYVKPLPSLLTPGTPGLWAWSEEGKAKMAGTQSSLLTFCWSKTKQFFPLAMFGHSPCFTKGKRLPHGSCIWTSREWDRRAGKGKFRWKLLTETRQKLTFLGPDSLGWNFFRGQWTNKIDGRRKRQGDQKEKERTLVHAWLSDWGEPRPLGGWPGKHLPESNVVDVIPNGGGAFPEWLLRVVQDWLEGTGRVMNSMLWRQEGAG